MNTSTSNRWFTVIILFLLSANMATLAFLWISHNKHNSAEHKPPPPNREVFQFITNELKLDSTQQQAFSKLREEHQAVQRIIQDSIRKAKDAFFALLQQPNVDTVLLQLAASKTSDLDRQLDLLTFRHFQKLRAICTAEQQQKFDSIIQEVLRQMAPRKNRQGPPPPFNGGEGPNRRPPPPPGNGPPHPGEENRPSDN